MLLSSIRRRVALCVMLMTVLATATPSLAAGPERFVDVIELTDHDDQADLVVQFNCSLRYLSHLPATEGSELRVQLQPLADCGTNAASQIAGELPPVSGGANILASANVESDVPGQLTLVLRWKRSEHFVIAQGIDPRGLRIRLLDRARGKVMINEAAQFPVTSYAVNLESQPKPFDTEAVKRAESRFKTPVYVAEVVVEGETWYRLRIGPIKQRNEAAALLQRAVQDYPRAWLAIGDEERNTEAPPGETLSAVGQMASDPALSVDALKQLTKEARAATSARDYPRAIGVLTKLQRQPEFAERAAMQELLGLARERSGQLAHAKAEYEEYLQRYPQGDAAERVRLRLRILREASMKANTGTGGGTSNQGWTASGGFGQMYRHDGSRISSSTNTAATQATSQSALYNDADLLLRHRGERLDFMTRISGGYAKNFGPSSSGNSSDLKRLSVASIELADTTLGLLGRLGRQSRNSGGVLGTFDGVYASCQWRPSWGVSVAAGYPVEQTSKGLNTERRFESLALAYTPPGAHWDASIYAASQQFQGLRDRQAIGVEGRWLAPSASLIALLDYDTFYRSLNTAALLGTLQLPARWNLSFDAEHRNSPVLSTRNALIGQNATTITELEQVFLPDAVYQLARDRTPVTANYSLTATRPLGQRSQFAATVAATRTGATPASGGVGETEATGLNISYQMQLYANNLWTAADFNVINLTYATTETGKSAAFGITSRLQLAGAWRMGPRFTVERQTLASDGSTDMRYFPSLLIDYQRERKLLQFEFGWQLGKRTATEQSQNTSRYYGSLAYRIGF